MRLFDEETRESLLAEVRILEACEMVHEYTISHKTETGRVEEVEKGAVDYLAKTLRFYRYMLDPDQIDILRALRRYAKVGNIKGPVARRVGRLVVQLEQSFGE